MTEDTAATAAKKPAVRRKKATGPTKPAALKKLGLSQEDLDLLDQVKEARANAAEAPAPSGTLTATGTVERAEPEVEVAFTSEATRILESTPPANEIPDQIEAKLKVYQTLKDAGLTIPDDISADVEAYVARRTDQSEQTGGPWFARNLRAVEFRFRLDRQKSGTKSTTLKPRGQRKDMVKLQPEDLDDDNLIANVELGILEIIPIQEARSILAKQATNQQQGVHPALAMIRNAKGEEYGPDALQTPDQFVDNSVVVAHLKPQGGGAGEIQVDRNGIQRTAAPQNPVGNPAIFSDGFADTAQSADAIARRKDIEGPAAGLGGLQYGGLDPVQKG